MYLYKNKLSTELHKLSTKLQQLSFIKIHKKDQISKASVW